MSTANGRTKPRDTPPEVDPNRLPPQNLEADRGVIGSILLDNNVIDDVIGVMRPDDLFRTAHQTIYRVMLELHSSGRAIDGITLCEELEKQGKLESVGGIEYIAETINCVPHAVNAKYYAGIVAENSQRRQVIDAAEVSLRQSYARAETCPELLDDVERRFHAIRDARVSARVIEGPALAANFRRNAIARFAAGPTTITGISTGIGPLDDITQGLSAGQLIVLAGRPSMGKSMAAQHISQIAAYKEGKPVLFATMEMPDDELTGRFVSSLSGVAHHDITNAAFFGNPEKERRVEAAERIIGGGHLSFDVTPGQTVSGLSAVARRQKRTGGLGLVRLWVVAPAGLCE